MRKDAAVPLSLGTAPTRQGPVVLFFPEPEILLNGRHRDEPTLWQGACLRIGHSVNLAALS